MNVLTPKELAAEGYCVTQYSLAADENPADLFDYGHYHQHTQGIDHGATEHGIALLARGIPLGAPELDVPQLTAVVPFGEWSRSGRYKNRFEHTDTELRAAFDSLKSAVSERSGYRFQALSPYPQKVIANTYESVDGWLLGVNKQYTSIVRQTRGIVADRRVVGIGTTLGEGLMLPINKDRAVRVQAVARNVAHILNEALATKVIN